MNRVESNDPLVTALRHLGQESSRGAPTELGPALAAAFRRYHRRRRARNAAIAALGVGCLVSASWLLLKPAGETAPRVVRDIPHSPTIAAPAPQPAVRAVQEKSSTVPRSHRRVQVAAREADDFFPLPAYDPVVPRNDLQIVRLEMPVQDLRLLGVPVNEELSNRRVLTDFVVGHDGTPYAVRFVH